LKAEGPFSPIVLQENGNLNILKARYGHFMKSDLEKIKMLSLGF
jgi:hypothetical protein